MNLKLSKSAANRIKYLISRKKEKIIALRVSVYGGGCSGFMYQYNLVDKVNDDDHILETDGVKIAVDPLSQEFLNDCTIEFIEELGSNYFQIKNPNASAKCGCGNSFAV